MKIDIGCGYNEELHYPDLNSDVSLDYNLSLVTERFLELLNNPIIADAQNLPFRSCIFKVAKARAILEHLEYPFKCIREIKRVLKLGGQGVFTIPIKVSHHKHYLKILITQFPFSLWDVIKCMHRMNPHLKIEGFYHKTMIREKHIIKYFNEHFVRTTYYNHKWFYGLWGSFIKKFITKGRIIKDTQGYYEVLVWK